MISCLVAGKVTVVSCLVAGKVTVEAVSREVTVMEEATALLVQIMAALEVDRHRHPHHRLDRLKLEPPTRSRIIKLLP